MSLAPQQRHSLSDKQGRELGQIVVERVEGDLVFGSFTPGRDYPAVERLFADYVTAANEQLLSIVGELDETIAGLGLRLHSTEATGLPEIHDVQIGAGVITFRMRPRLADGRPVRAPQSVVPPAPSPDVPTA